MGYRWEFETTTEGDQTLKFEITYSDSGEAYLTMLEGSMDLNALWFSDGDETPDETADEDEFPAASSLRGKDRALNMNGSEVAWDAYAKIKAPGFESEEEKEDTLIEAGDDPIRLEDFEAYVAALEEAEGDVADLTVGVRATTVNEYESIDPDTGEVVLLDDSIKLVDSEAEFYDDIPPTLAGEEFSYFENQAAGYEVGTVTGVDPNGEEEDGTISGYQFAATGNTTSADGLFVISSTGVISFATDTETSAANDFETPENSFTYGIQAIDTAGNVSEAADVSITVEDQPLYQNPTPLGVGDSGSGQSLTPMSRFTADPEIADYWAIDLSAGDSVAITVTRGEEDFDPYLWLFEGIVTDPITQFGSSLDSDDPGFIARADDEITPSIPFPDGPFGDPQIFYTASSDITLTAIVTEWLSGPDTGGDGRFDYIIDVAPVI